MKTLATDQTKAKTPAERERPWADLLDGLETLENDATTMRTQPPTPKQRPAQRPHLTETTDFVAWWVAASQGSSDTQGKSGLSPETQALREWFESGALDDDAENPARNEAWGD